MTVDDERRVLRTSDGDVGLMVIYVALLEEGTDVWRPVDSREERPGVYRILSTKSDPDEVWQFPKGSVVRCEERVADGERCLFAVETAS
jgi:hypothetical protein